MFYEVRILDANDHLKKLISTKELSRRYWISFKKSQGQNILPQVKKRQTQNN